VDLAVGQDAPDCIDRSHNTGLPIVVQADVTVPMIRVFPGDHENGMSACDEPLHQGVLRRQIQHVVFHDPGRNDQGRFGKDRLGHRCVLDQLHQIIAQNYLAFGRRDSGANHKCLGAGRGRA